MSTSKNIYFSVPSQHILHNDICLQGFNSFLMDLRDMHAWMAHLGTMVSCTNKAFWCFAWWSVLVAQRLSFLDHLQLPITITNYPRFWNLSVRRKLPNPSSEMDDDLDGIIRQAKALETLGSKIIRLSTMEFNRNHSSCYDSYSSLCNKRWFLWITWHKCLHQVSQCKGDTAQ